MSDEQLQEWLEQGMCPCDAQLVVTCRASGCPYAPESSVAEGIEKQP